MEWKSNLRRAKSLSLPLSCDQPTWTETGRRDKTTSVSQLVSRYQTTVEVNTSIQEALVNDCEAKPRQVLKEITKESPLEALMWRNDEKEQARAKTNLARSKSMGSLQNSAGSIGALKALFESKAAPQNVAKSSFRAQSCPSPCKTADIMPVMNGEAEEVKSSAEKPKIQLPPDVPANDAMEDHVTRKVVNQTRVERRKTIGGIDFEKIAASQADEKRRSIADFRDSSFFQTKEKLTVSVKAMSALYLSKVAPQEPPDRHIKPGQSQSSESGKGVKLTKMTEDSQHRSTRHQPGPEDISGAHFQQSVPSQLSKEKLYQQRQKCELRRLLKHTHPELKMLDDVVDDELAEVLSSETGVTTGETGYEGEVLSRRLIFENCALSGKVSPCTPKWHMAERTVGKSDVTTAVFEEHEEMKPCGESVKGMVEEGKTLSCSPDPNTECEIRIDVQATRRIFESQCVNPDDNFQGKNSTSGDVAGAIKKQKLECRKEKSNACTKSHDLTDPTCKQEPCVHVIGQTTNQECSGREEVCTGEFENETSFSDSEKCGEIIKTRAALFKNNPFIQTNMEREQSSVHTTKSQSPGGDSGEPQDYLITNVKNRAHLFESMPFDKIRHQNKDEVETMVENIKETLNFLHCVNAIHSDGSIIEVSETMIAKKAKFTLSEGEPKIKYDEVAEGGAQNFILQLLPRANLKPQVTYLKEDSKGCLEATLVNVPMHQHHFTTGQDTEFKTANVAQVVEDILNQDNSLRKGVIIQEDLGRHAEVIVYSLYNYFDEEDVKSYSPPQSAEYDETVPERGDVSKTDNQELRKGAVESTMSCLLETSKGQTCQGSERPEITVKGNVKLFKTCIEKGDLEYLKSLQAEPTVQGQDLPLDQNVEGQAVEPHHEQRGDKTEESTSEWVPVDVKRLKNMFSGDHRPVQPKQNTYESIAQSTAISSAFTGQNVPFGKSQSFTECSVGQPKYTFRECGAQTQNEACNSTDAPHGSCLHLEAQNDDRVHKAEVVEAVDDTDEISNLQTAIRILTQATIEARSLHHSSQGKQKCLVQETSEEPVVSFAAGYVKHSRTEAEIRKGDDITSGHTSDRQQEDKETCNEETNPKEVGQKGTYVDQKSATVSVHSSDTTAAQEEAEEVVLQGKLQAALNSLERSNINVTRGDFKAAMIYRNYSKPHKETQNVDPVSGQKPTKEEFAPVTEPKATHAPLRRKASEEQVTAANADPPSQSETLHKAATSAALEKGKRPVGPKPAIPPKPEHLKVKQGDFQSTNTKNPEITQTNDVIPEETVPESLPLMPPVPKDGYKQDQLNINSNENSGPDSVDLQTNELSDDAILTCQNKVGHQVQGSLFTLKSDDTDKNIVNQQLDIDVTTGEKSSQDFSVKQDRVDFHEDCRKFGGKNFIDFSVKNAPVKPKRVKIAQPDNKKPQHMSGDNDPSVLTYVVEEPQHTPTAPSRNNTYANNTCGQTADSQDKHEKQMKQEGKVEMREKKGRSETEDERRQRLSVHMDEIMRGNITAAMEIFDNLRKQEALQSILSRVEEIEHDTSEVDVRALRGVFEGVPEWVVSSGKMKQKKVENKEERMPLTRDSTESKSSMAHVFGDLERASEEIMNLKEQTLARLMDIEGAIKKALYSVSTLKSDSDIAGLSCLFKESLGTVQGSPSSGNIRKISIGSSKTKLPLTQENIALPISQSANTDVASAKQRASPPSSPAFISIQSAARKTDKADLCPTCQHSPKTAETFRTTTTLTCNSPAQNRKGDPRKGGQKQSSYHQLNPKRELSVLEVQTDREGNSIMGTKTVTENYERTDNLGNRFYSSKTSTVVTSQPEMATGQTVVSPAAYQVTKYPEVQLPINQKP